jgi:glycosyltransferase domain-containing protein
VASSGQVLTLITIVIPTLNRPAFVVRALEHLAAAGFDGEVLVGDSSDGEAARHAREAIARLRPRLRAAHLDCRGMDDRLTLHRLACEVRSPYVAYMGDDDFLIPSGISECIAFLEREPSFVAANGQGWTFEVRAGQAHGRFRVYESYRQPELTEDSAQARLDALLADYLVGLFSVHRSEAWKEMWRRSPDVRDRTFSAELLPCCLSAVLGKTKRLDCLYLLRQSVHAAHYVLPRAGDWTASVHWRPSLDTFCEEIARKVQSVDDTAGAMPASAIEKRFVELYVKRLFPSYGERRADAAAGVEPSGLRRWARSVPGIHAAFLRAFRWYWRMRMVIRQRHAILDAIRFSLRLKSPWMKSFAQARKDLQLVRKMVESAP